MGRGNAFGRRHLRLIDDLVEFVRGRGYVLDFSDSSFSQFFAAELDVDIDDSIYSEHGGSNGKRLCCFLVKNDGATAARTLQALWEHRTEWLTRTGHQTPFLTLKADT